MRPLLPIKTMMSGVISSVYQSCRSLILRKYSLWILVGASLLLSACVFVPVVQAEFDARCQVTRRHMTLEPVQLAAITHCHSEDCVAFVALSGVTAAATIVISGSVMLLGNMVFWLEEPKHCGTELSKK